MLVVYYQELPSLGTDTKVRNALWPLLNINFDIFSSFNRSQLQVEWF